MLVAAIACQAGANLANDYFDDRKGVDTIARPGSSTVLQTGAISPQQMLVAMIVCFVLAFVVGMVIVLSTSWSVFVLALACLVLAIAYSGGPIPLSHLALGEVVTFLSMGLALGVGPILVLTGVVSRDAILISLPNAFIVTALLHVNNTRDIERDRAAGKRTVAQLLGPSRALWLFALLLTLAYVALAVAILARPQLWPIAIALASLPASSRLVRQFAAAETEPGFTAVLRGVNRLQLRFGLLVVAGLILSIIVARQEL